jgi:SAM-dependent methyltransferase
MKKREDYIKNYLKPEISVLDIGSCGQTNKYSLWNFLKQENIHLVGIDIVKSNDPSIVFGNMEYYDFHCQFDLIIAGDVLEHIENQGIFLRNIHKHLKKDGVFILTTPNAKWPTVILKPNPTHTLWHDRYTLEFILKQCGVTIVHFQYYYGNKPHYPLVVRPLIWRQSMFLVCKKK